MVVHPLDSYLSSDASPFSDALRSEIISRLWKSIRLGPNTFCSLYGFFEYYSEQCTAIEPEKHVAKSHRDLMNIIEHIRMNPSIPKTLLRTGLKERYQNLSGSDAETDNSMELAVRIWLLFNLRNGYGELRVASTSLAWPENLSIEQVIQGRFPKIVSPAPSAKIRFSRLLTGCSLERIAGFTVRWTDNLLDHLALEYENTVCVFYHASIAQCLKSDGKVLAPDFLEETLNTIALLFPGSDPKCRTWLKKRPDFKYLDQAILTLQTAPRELERYLYWRDRLMIIEEAFNKHEPATLGQWRRDKRRKVVFSTFWVALAVLVLTIIFGVIQSVASIVQAWASVRSLKGEGKPHVPLRA